MIKNLFLHIIYIKKMIFLVDFVANFISNNTSNNQF